MRRLKELGVIVGLLTLITGTVISFTSYFQNAADAKNIHDALGKRIDIIESKASTVTKIQCAMAIDLKATEAEEICNSLR